jgi:hypothetical protein
VLTRIFVSERGNYRKSDKITQLGDSPNINKLNESRRLNGKEK